MKKPSSMTATRLRLILSVSLFAILLITGGVIFYIDQQLQAYAISVSHSVIDANASQDSVSTLQKIQQTLNDDKDIITKTNNIVADSKSYQYQDQIINDINGYAAQSGISITNIDFPSTATTPTAGATSPTAGITTPTVAPTGVKSTSVEVTIKNPVGYSNFLQFIHAIENNLTRMQIQKISLSKGSDGTSVSSDVLTLQVYVR